MSEEHKFKASDIKRNYGKKFKQKNKLIYFEDGKSGIELNSYKAKELKHPKVICIDCNNNKTKASDNAYDKFVVYIGDNWELLNKNLKLNFEKIYGENWRNEKENFYRYVAKQAGCKIVTGDFPYHISQLANFILKQSEISNFKLKFEIKQRTINILENIPSTILIGNGSTTYIIEPNGSFSYSGSIEYNLTINWVFSNRIRGDKIPNFNKRIEPIYFELESKKSNISEIVKYIFRSPYAKKLKRIEYWFDLLIN